MPGRAFGRDLSPLRDVNHVIVDVCDFRLKRLAAIVVPRDGSSQPIEQSGNFRRMSATASRISRGVPRIAVIRASAVSRRHAVRRAATPIAPGTSIHLECRCRW